MRGTVALPKHDTKSSSFVDDDNWVSADWIIRVSGVMSSRLDLGALAPVVYPVFEIPAPAWFDRFQHFYAVTCGRMYSPEETLYSYLCGAGLSVRKDVWAALVRAGFSLNVEGRKGTRLGGADDLELTSAIRLAGWTLYIDPTLRAAALHARGQA